MSMVNLEPYEGEHQLPDITKLVEADLSEPYSIYTYRYFLHAWPSLSFLAKDSETNEYVGVIICKIDQHRHLKRGYIGMLTVRETHRKKKIGTLLANAAIQAMREKRVDEVALETECSNKAALRFYEHLGFLRDKRMANYYLNGSDAFRLKLWLNSHGHENFPDLE